MAGWGWEKARPAPSGLWAIPMGSQVSVEAERRKHGADAVGYRPTHGRHCACMPCREQDWDEPGLAPCGMHGDACCGDPGDCTESCP
jgi:hypothetical protein